MAFLVDHCNPRKQYQRFWQWSSYLFLLLYLSSEMVRAQPDMARKLVLDDFVVYRDAKIYNLFYYLPGDLDVATDNEGKPDFKLLMMRYTGTSAYDDQGSHRSRNLMQMRIIQSSIPQDVLKTVKQKLKGLAPDPELRTFPIKNLKTVLVYSIVGATDSQEASVSDQEGYFSQENEDIRKDEYWKERNFVVRLDNESATIFWDALQNQQTILSVGFAFYSEVFNSARTDLSISGTNSVVEKMNEMIKTETENARADTLLDTRVVKAGAFEVIIDTEKWPDLIKKVDINEQIPPDYAAINVYCYDFNNELRLDLAQKKVEIEATGVGGEKVTLKYTFRNDAPDIYVCDLKFPYAVRIDTPYRYRVTEITTGGSVSRTEWITKGSWHEILDITSKSDN
jgi:hypothetical protein